MNQIDQAKEKIQSAIQAGSDTLNLNDLRLISDDLVELVPIIQRSLPNLKELKLNNNDFEELPQGIALFTNLERLRLNGNKLTTLSDEIGQLTNLKVLEANNNKIAHVSIEIANLSNLEGLGLENNELSELPDALGDLKKLKGLDLKGNKFAILPSCIQHFVNLEGLNLGNNALSELPHALGGLKKLTRVNLANNKFAALPSCIQDLVNLNRLNLEYNRLSAIPEGIGKLTKLKNLDLGNNKLAALPSAFDRLEELEFLGLSKNEFEQFPPVLTGLKNLEGLNLDGNGLSEVPEAIHQLTKLKDLDLGNNKFDAVPMAVLALGELEVLNLRGNGISEVPQAEEMEGLSNLKLLNLERNRLMNIPLALSSIPELEVLNLKENNISEVPEELGRLRELNPLMLTENPLTARAMIALNGIYRDRVVFNRTPFQLDADSQPVLEKLYPRRKIFLKSWYMAERKIRQAVSNIDTLEVAAPFHDGEGKILNAQQVVYGLLSVIPHEGAQVNNMYFESAKDLLAPVLSKRSSPEAKEHSLQQIVTAEGNCATPQLDLLIQNYLGKQNRENRRGKRSDNLEALIQREALEKEILKKLGNAVDEEGNRIMPNFEKIEQVQGLVNTIFLEGAAELEHNMIKVEFPDVGPAKLPSKTAFFEFGFEQIRPPLATAFAKLICKTNADGALQTIGEGRYVFDPQKMDRIVNKYKNALGDTSARETWAAKYPTDMRRLLDQEENQVLLLEYDDAEVIALLDFDKAQEELRDRLYGVTDEEVVNEYKTYLLEQTVKIGNMVNRFAMENEAAVENVQSQGPSGGMQAFTIPLNTERRATDTPRASAGMATNEQARPRSQGREL